MANSITASMSVSLSFTQQDTAASSSLQEQTSTTTSYSFTNGTGVAEVNGAFHVSGVLNSGTEVDLDLSNLTRRIYGTQQVVDFTDGNIKSLVIANSSTGLFYVAATGTQGLQTLFSGTGNIPVPPNSAFTYVNSTGLPVDSNNFLIQLFPGENTISTVYDFAVIGVTGTS
jgi:hypothetical protein